MLSHPANSLLQGTSTDRGLQVQDVALKLVARPSPLRINRNRASKMGASENPGRAAPTVSSPRHARESFPSVR